jgi:uncharacterized protein (TIGR02145 family)
MKKIILLFAGLAFLTCENKAQTVTDIDGNVYNTVTIGTQTWMKENLKVTHYNNGVPIPNVTNNNIWDTLTTGARAYYNNDSAGYAPVHGALYNWYAVINLCPTHWHVPVDNDWIVLIGYLGGTNNAGGKLKSITGWNSPNSGATNSSGFSAKAGGDRYDSGPFNYIGFFGHWWSSTANGGSLRWALLLSYDTAQALTYYFNVNNGFLVRCVCDSVVTKINETGADEFLKIYPNPAIESITIKCLEKNGIKINISNIFGECVLQKELSSGTNDIDISSLAKGIYIIEYTNSNFTIKKKLIKE